MLEAIGQDIVSLQTILPNGSTKKCNTLDVPKLSYHLLSVSKASKAGYLTTFDQPGCPIKNSNQKVIAAATRVGSLDCRAAEHC